MDWQNEFNQTMCEAYNTANKILMLTEKLEELYAESKKYTFHFLKTFAAAFFLTAFAFYIFSIINPKMRTIYENGFTQDWHVWFFLTIFIIVTIIFYRLIIKIGKKSRDYKVLAKGNGLQTNQVYQERRDLYQTAWIPISAHARKLAESAIEGQFNNEDNRRAYREGIVVLDGMFRNNFKDTSNDWKIAVVTAIGIVGVIALAAKSGIDSWSNMA